MLQPMNRQHTTEPVRCNVCRRTVDAATRERARWAFQPLVICETCVREADSRWTMARSLVAA